VKPSPYPAPAGCADPSLGARATQALGHVPPAAVAAHLAACPACSLQRVAFAGLGARSVPPPPGLRAHLRRVALERFPTSR
jgi:hypothetical protein